MVEKHLAVKSVKKYREANQCGEQDHQILNAVVISLMRAKGKVVQWSVGLAGWQEGIHFTICLHGMCNVVPSSRTGPPAPDGRDWHFASMEAHLEFFFFFLW